MKALLVGGNGFIGKNFCEFLKTIDVEFDTIGRKDLLPPTFPDYDYIFYLAGEVRKPEDMYFAHVSTLYGVLCRSLDIHSTFVYVGSSSEYGRMDEPMTEEHAINPTNLYEATKGVGTLLCQGFARQFNRPILIVRPSSVYGKYERPEKFIPTIIRNIQNKEKINVYRGNHDWIYIQDFIDALFRILTEADPDKLFGEIYNISSARQYSNLEVAHIICDMVGCNTASIIFHEENFHQHDCDCWVVDNSKVMALGWEPKYELRTGLKETLKAMGVI